MKIISDRPFNRFEAWSGGKDTQNKIIEAGKEEEFEAHIEELYPDGITDTQLNDLLWFSGDEILTEWLGIEEESEEDEEKEDTDE